MNTAIGEPPSGPNDHRPDPRPRPLATGPAVAAAVLLAIPLVALALVGTYARSGPTLWGFPFFYWYQMMWVILTPIFTVLAYLVIKRARGDR